MTTTTEAERVWHHRDPQDSGRCACGGITVWFDDGDRDGYVGEGCEVDDRVYADENVDLCEDCKADLLECECDEEAQR